MKHDIVVAIISGVAVVYIVRLCDAVVSQLAL